MKAFRLNESGRPRLSLLLLCILTGLSQSCSKSDHAIEDTEKLVAEMSQRVVATTRMEKRGDLIPRFNQPKTIACLHGEFTVADNVPDILRHGLFAAPGQYPVTARFANASKWDDSEKDIRGLSLRVSGVESETLWGESGLQDFLLNSYPALFVATPEEFLKFMRARQEGDKKSLIRFFLHPSDPHLKSLFTVLKARRKHSSPLDIRYWSTVPSALDGNLTAAKVPTDQTQAVKYSMTPCSTLTTKTPVEPGENQLRAALKSHLTEAPACFNFGVQLRTHPDKMPLEDASVIWDEELSPFVTVAQVQFENQSFDEPEALETCEKSQFNPWQSLPAHTPMGRMNAVRKAVYATGSYQRNQR